MRLSVRSLKELEKSSVFYRKIQDTLANIALLIPIALVPAGYMHRQGVLDDRFYLGDGWFIGFIFSITVLAIGQYFFLRKFPTDRNYLISLAAFHLVGVVYILTVGGISQPFLPLWIVLFIASVVNFGWLGYLGSLGLLILTTAASMLFSPFLTSDELMFIACSVSAVAAVGFSVTQILMINNHERLLLVRTRQQEAFQRDRLLALINSMGDAVITTDQHGKIKVYNAATLNLLDTNVDLFDKNIDDVLNLFNQNRHQISILRELTNAKGIYSRTDLSHKFPDKEMARLYINIAPIRSSYSHPSLDRGYIFIMRDITKEKTLEEERDEFVSVVSHELRTPVAIAEGNLSNLKLMQDRKIDPKMAGPAINATYDQILYLSQLINDLSTLSRAERGITDELGDVNLTDFIHELHKNYQKEAEAKKLHLNLDLAPKLPIVKTSRLYLQEIMQNMIVNAIKYTEHGSVTIGARPAEGGILIEVRDTGIGISKSDQKHVFEKFYRSEDYRTRSSSGTGLGLYVCRKLAHKLGFSLEFESRLNHGSRFYFVLPEKPVDSLD